ncbi:NAD(P)/FAD-dependent oxidoreductase [Actinomadura sp. SCN-SB]|uniref:NAD(P)/FAD-dependent oxidoreductase n=1 Tax=Actinomadura sp. SCN-SB TaxID=3373092 RepID=UPI003752D66F
MSEPRRIVVVGASLAGLRAAEALRRQGFTGTLTIVGDESRPPYDRPPLSKELLRGECTGEDVKLAAHASLDAVWRLGSPAVSLDPAEREVVTASGDRIPYDGLVVATGSSPRTLPGLPDAHTIRTIDDAYRLRRVLSEGTRLLIVGCGFIGVEVASSAVSLGARVTMVGLDPPVAPAGRVASARAARLLAEAGVALHVGRTVADAGNGQVTLSDGTELDADQIVVAVGAAPNAGWLAGSGADTSDGVLCDASLRVAGLDGVVAAGDVARWPNATFGGMVMRVEHWSNAVEQATAAARTLLAGDAAAPFGSVPSFWSDHFGVRLQSVGLPRLADRFEVVEGEPDGDFCAHAYAGDVLVGGVAYGMARPLAPVRVKLVKAGVRLPASVA